MAPTLLDGQALRHRVLPEKAQTIAKADLRKTEMDDLRLHIARAIVCPVLDGYDLGEISALIFKHTGREIDERQIARWRDGKERPQFDALLPVPEFKHRIVLAFAAAAGDGVEIETTLRIRRIA